LIKALEEKNFQIFTHSKVPANDGGICLGQAMVAAAVTSR
jgi:hydrogenase maturation protein HypF